ncbi:MAG: hypothetical protein REI64_00645 [Pedobacter sp.]|uniref:hypothetical protein n=1 Tax=Pedobacter sp. TaxID=1411316 RepID=UPI0028078F4B|nr:hypothetical protein [Pedobacter sp.]MDQ8003270.1 hypothetical protein [Pedobacter sp.]
MKQAIIKYRSNKTLDALKELGKYLGFSISSVSPKGKKSSSTIKGATVIEGDPTVDIAGLHEIFTGKGLDALELRKSGWHRNK